jgi:spore coat protein U-like protein
MRLNLHVWLLLLALVACSAGADAAITCSVSSSGFSTAYSPAAAGPTVTQSSFTVTCNRGATSDPTSVSYAASADNGQNALGINNRAAYSGAFIRYDAYIDSGCGTQWKGNVTIGGSMSFTTTGPVSKVHNYWACIGASQTGLAAGTYSDLVTMTLNYGPNPQSTYLSSFPVNIATPATCGMSPTPGTVAFGNYVAFGPALATNTSFGATCTNYLPYTVAITPTTGTIAGLTYNLLLNLSGLTGTTLSVTGNGAQQSYTIDGSMTAGQAGTCATGLCTGSVTHTLTLTY